MREGDSVYHNFVQLFFDKTEYALSICAIPTSETREKALLCLIKIISKRSEELVMRKLNIIVTHESKIDQRGEHNSYKLVHAFSRLYFNDYLKSSLTEVLTRICEKDVPTISTLTNDQREAPLLELALRVIDAIQSTLDNMPCMLSDVCLDLLRIFGHHKPIGDLLLTEFFCPAITFAEMYDIIPAKLLGRETRYILSSVSKLINKSNVAITERNKEEASQLQLAINELLNAVTTIQESPTALRRRKKSYARKIIDSPSDDHEGDIFGSMNIRNPKTDSILFSPSTVLYRRMEKDKLLYHCGESKEDELFHLMSSAYCYHPMFENTPTGNVIRTEEITSRLMTCGNKDEFIAHAFRCGTIVVPVDWVRHKFGMRLKDIEKTYSRVAVDDKQIAADLQRDHLRINGCDFICVKDLGKISSHLSSLLLKFKYTTNSEDSDLMAITLLNICGRTMCGGDSFDAVNTVYGGNRSKRKSAVSNENLPPVGITCDNNTNYVTVMNINEKCITCESVNKYRIMDLSNFMMMGVEAGIWFSITATTRWLFEKDNTKHVGEVIMQPDLATCPLGYLSKLGDKKLESLRECLNNIYQMKRQI
ncbi:gapvd1 [Acrasis kona]|uniref:Gapvd1 n=1 Tax=Acrasis kona TaxID=1008807 RepID=A0AAW2Z4D8_9EUKA